MFWMLVFSVPHMENITVSFEMSRIQSARKCGSPFDSRLELVREHMTDESMPRPSFDHCYRSIADDSVYKNFERLGFKLNPDPVIHPGRLKCQFLHFLSPAGTSVYLEFLFRDHTLPMSSEKPEEPMIHAGFALKVGKDLHQVFGEYQNDQPQLKPKFEHRNYKIDSNPSLNLPGWNFLTFENAPVPDVEVWLIEYEPIPGRTEAELQALR